MKRCETCKHWQIVKDWLPTELGFRKCHGVQERWRIEEEIPEEAKNYKYEYGEGHESIYQVAEKQLFSKKKAYTQDASNYVADLITAKDFGCILHEEVK